MLQCKLRVANLDANLVFDLLQPHLRLAVFQLGANLYGLGVAIAKRNVQSEPDAFVRRAGIDQIIQRWIRSQPVYQLINCGGISPGVMQKLLLVLVGEQNGRLGFRFPPNPEPP